MSMAAVWMISAKFSTLGLLKIKVFWNKGCDVEIFVHDVTSKIQSREQDYIVEVVRWSKLGNPRISLREIVITRIL